MFDKINTLLSAAKTKSTKRLIIDMDELINLVKPGSDYSEAYDKAKRRDFIYRGANQYGDNYLAVEYTPGKRISENTSNIYTKLLSDIFPSWKKFPKRNRSTVATFSYDKATSYGGTIYIVLPKNGTEIAICPTNDFWLGFTDYLPKTIYDLGRFNYYLAFLMGTICKFSGTSFIEKTDVEEIFLNSNVKVKELFKKFDEGINILVGKTINEINSSSSDEIFEYMFEKSDLSFELSRYEKNILKDYINYYFQKNRKTNFLSFLENKIFNNSNFKIQEISQIESNNESEVWFEGTSLFIPIMVFGDLVTKV
jgi:hypothetical protein